MVFYKLDALYTYFSIKHIYGESLDKLKDKKGFFCVVMVKNESYLIDSFLQYYFALGASHIIVLDNNSSDNTLEKLYRYKNVTILSSKLIPKYEHREIIFRQYMINRYCRNRWCLKVDADEYFDYPFSDIIPIDKLFQYLEINKFDTVITQMLDMLSLEDVDGTVFKRDEYKYFHLESIAKSEFMNSSDCSKNKNPINLTNEKIKYYRGGIRRKLFNTDNMLTKHSLFFSTASDPLNIHFLRNPSCADLSAVIFHYKFHRSFSDKSVRYLQDGFGLSSEYSPLSQGAQKISDLSKSHSELIKFNDVNQLVDLDFLQISENYRDFVLKER